MLLNINKPAPVQFVLKALQVRGDSGHILRTGAAECAGITIRMTALMLHHTVATLAHTDPGY
ncbi:MAG: hypothetical protein ABSG25_16180 [Bryobacteraceae bacterium]